MKKMVCGILAEIAALGALACMLFGNGIVMVFASSPTQRVTRYYNYLSPVVFGYGNWFAPIAAILTIACCILLLFFLLGKAPLKLAVIFQWMAFAFSALAVVAFSSFTVAGVLAAVLLGLGLLFLYLGRQINKEV